MLGGLGRERIGFICIGVVVVVEVDLIVELFIGSVIVVVVGFGVVVDVISTVVVVV